MADVRRLAHEAVSFKFYYLSSCLPAFSGSQICAACVEQAVQEDPGKRQARSVQWLYIYPIALENGKTAVVRTTMLLLCVADSHPGMFKTLAACKLKNVSCKTELGGRLIHSVPWIRPPDRNIMRPCRMQTALLLCVADSHPGMFKTLAACKLEIISSEFGEDSIQVWAAITVSALSLQDTTAPCASICYCIVCFYL